METRKETKSSRVLKNYMDATGLAVVEVAKRTGLTRQFIHMLLNGQHEVGFRSAMKLKEGLGISLDKWVNQQEEK